MRTERATYILLVACFLLVVAWGTIILLRAQAPRDLTLEKAGTFGDSFGVITALFSGLAFAGLLGTLWLQRDELRLQREELRLTREELKRASSAQAEQVEALRDTARLNALATLTSAYTDMSLTKVGGQPPEAESARLKRDELLESLEDLLTSMKTPSENEDHI